MNQQQEKYYKALCDEVQTEISKASQLLGFLGILIFVALGKLSDLFFEMKVGIFIIMTTSVILLLYTILWKWYLGLPKSLKKLEVSKEEKSFKQRYERAYVIWKEKHTLNFISFLLLVVIFVLVVFSIFFL